MTADSATTWVTLRTFDTQPMAELARVALLNAGIPCRILNAEVVSMDWLLGNAVGYIPLQVPAEHLEVADEALGGGSESDLPPSHCANCGEPLDNDGPCPMCGHDGDADSTRAQPSERASERRVDTEDDGVSAGSLDGLRNFGKTAISAYLIFVFLSFLVSALGAAMLIMNGVL